MPHKSAARLAHGTPEKPVVLFVTHVRRITTSRALVFAYNALTADTWPRTAEVVRQRSAHSAKMGTFGGFQIVKRIGDRKSVV